MNQNAIKSLSKTLRSIAEKAQPPKTGGFENFRLHDGVSYTLQNEDARELNELKRKFLKINHWEERFSENFISKKIDETFASLLIDENFNIEEKIEDIATELDNYDKESTVYLQVCGLVLDQDIKIGNVIFKKGEQLLIDKLFEDVKNITVTLKNDEKTKEYFFELTKKHINEGLLGNNIAEYVVVAEADRAFERAKEEVRRSFEIIRFASKAIYPLRDDVKVGLKGEAGYTTEQGFIFSSSSYSDTGDSLRSGIPFEISKFNLEKMDKIGCFTLSAIMQKKQPTQYEKVLLRSLHWYSTATMQKEIENSFLALIIALETLFTPEEGSPISNAIAEAVALILADNLDARKKIKTFVKSYYRRRSAVSHGGEKSITDSEYYNLLSVVGATIMKLIQKADQFKDKKELLEWIEDLKLS